MHALIIEDVGIIAVQIELYLSSLGFTSFACVATEAEAIASAKHHCPDFIIADVRLAAGDGIDAVEEICAGQSIPVVYATGYPEAVRQRVHGATIVTKPFAERALRAAVASVLASAGAMGT